MGSREEVKNSPGRQSVVPYTSSAAVQWISSLSAVRTITWEVRASNTQEWGRFSGWL